MQGPSPRQRHISKPNIRAFGGFEIDRLDPTNGEHTTTTAADPYAITDDLLAWVGRR